MRYSVEMYEKLDGSMPVQEFIQALQIKQQAKIAREIDLLEKFGSELHFPHVDKMKVILIRIILILTPYSDIIKFS